MPDDIPQSFGDLEATAGSPPRLNYEKAGHTQDTIEKLGRDLNTVYQTNGVARNGVTFLRGAVFALSSGPLGNEEWREHAAASLRELLHEWKADGPIATAFCKAFLKNGNGFPTMKSHANEYKRLEHFYAYFSAICHHSPTYILFRLRALYGEDIKAGDDTDETFLRAVKDFIQELSAFFAGHSA